MDVGHPKIQPGSAPGPGRAVLQPTCHQHRLNGGHAVQLRRVDGAAGRRWLRPEQQGRRRLWWIGPSQRRGRPGLVPIPNAEQTEAHLAIPIASRLRMLQDAAVTSRTLRLSVNLALLSMVLLTSCTLEEAPHDSRKKRGAKESGERQQGEANSTKSSDKPEPDPNSFTIECTDPENYDIVLRFVINRQNPNFKRAWATTIPVEKKLGFPMCEEVETGPYGGGPKVSPITAVERAIWNRGTPPRSRSTITDVYVGCVEHDTDELLNDYPGAPNIIDEATTMLTLCPNHPNAAAIQQDITLQQGFEQQIIDGTTLRDGDFIVGQDVQPGTYRTSSAGTVFDCVWSRRDASDMPIASGGKKKGTHELTVTIRAGDYLFSSQGCGIWFRIDG